MDRFLLYRSYDELEVGQTQRTRGRTITETDIVNWCSLTGDWFYPHIDSVAAERSMFGQRVALRERHNRCFLQQVAEFEPLVRLNRWTHEGEIERAGQDLWQQPDGLLLQKLHRDIRTLCAEVAEQCR